MDVVGGFYVRKGDQARKALRVLADHLGIPVPSPGSDGYVELSIPQDQIVLAADEAVPDWRENGWFDFPPTAA